MVNAPLMRRGEIKLSEELLDEMPAGAILHFHDPDVGIEADLALQIGFHVGFGRRLRRQAGREGAVAGMRILEGGLRRRSRRAG
jgi:hypothetical protein